MSGRRWFKIPVPIRRQVVDSGFAYGERIETAAFKGFVRLSLPWHRVRLLALDLTPDAASRLALSLETMAEVATGAGASAPAKVGPLTRAAMERSFGKGASDD